jgi:gluconate 2-dehydrogenase gamma chain
MPGPGLLHLSESSIGEAVPSLTRRHLLASTAVAFLILPRASWAGVIRSALPWDPDASDPPKRVMPGPWQFFSPAEGSAVEALADRLIPPDPETPGGKDAGCAVFLDRQLAGPYGRAAGLYRGAPFQPGLKQQGPQSALTPAEQYRQDLAGLDRHCRAAYGGRPFVQLPAEQQDQVIAQLENGTIQLDGKTGKSGSDFFDLILKDTQQGFFADPIYGGNKDMAAWKMIGFPGARYDYRDWVDRHNERYPHPPVGIGLHPDWAP